MQLPTSNVVRHTTTQRLAAKHRRTVRALYCSLLLAACGPPSWQGGIHAVLAWSHAGLRVVEVPPVGPSKRADLRAGDRIVAIDGKPLADRSFRDVQRLLSGEVGSHATIEVLRDDQPLTLRIEREPYAKKGVVR